MSDLSYKPVLTGFLLICLNSCTSTSVAPVDSRATSDLYQAAPVTSYDPEPVTKGFHEVIKGDTLYSISWRYGLDYRDVAFWNNITGQYIIYPGQRIGLIPGQTRIPRQQQSTQAQKPSQPPASQTRSAIVNSLSDPVLSQKNIKWGWPTVGRIIKSNTPIAQKGVDISGSDGQDIQAAADGVVVYSGSGLLGYGKLIIIKHNDAYLSAYAHNKIMQVKEGDKVNGGQKISTMGLGNKGQPILHFEIRKEGKPVDPLQFLPVRS